MSPSSHQKDLTPTMSSSKIIKNNGSIILQNWNTKTHIPKEIEEYMNMPIIVSTEKVKPGTSNNILPPLEKNYFDNSRES